MRAPLLGLLAVLLLLAGAATGASAAKKRDAKAPEPPPQDSVLYIPRVESFPDLETLLRRMGQKDLRHAKARGGKTADPKPVSGPERAVAVGAATAVGKTVEPAKAAEAPGHPPGDSGSSVDTSTTPARDSLERRIGELEGLVESLGSETFASSPSTLAGVSTAASSQRPPPAGSPPAAIPVGLRSAQAGSSSAGSRAAIPPPPTARAAERVGPDSERFDASTAGFAPPAPGSSSAGQTAAAPPGAPVSPPRRSSPGPAEQAFLLRVIEAIAVVVVAWTLVGWLRARPRRNAGDADAAPAVADARGSRGRARLRRMILANCWRVKGRLLLAALFMAGGAAAELLKPWPLKIVLDHVLLAKPVHGALAFLEGISADRYALLLVSAAAVVVVSVLSGLFSYLQIFITKAIGYRMVYELRREVFAHFQRLSLSFHSRARSGDLLTTFGSDTNTLKNIFAEAMLQFVDHSLTVIGMLVILWFVNWKMCLLAVATLPILCLTLMNLYRRTKASLKLQRRQEGRVVSRVNEVLAAVPLVQAFGRERYEEERYEAVSKETLRESIRMTRLEAAATRSTYMVSAAGSALVVLFGGIEVLQGRMLPGEMVLVMSYLTSMYKPLRNLAKLSTEVSRAAASADRIGEVLAIEPEILDRPDAIEADGIRGGILFAAVTFDYGDGRDVLRNVSFEVLPGQQVALVGMSGAGKSTIASLILRLYEAQRGVILVDGVEIARYRLESLRRQIGIVLQEALLFGATIRENIAYGKPGASEEEVVAAARTANADEFIREMEEGYDSVVGERGVTLSAGQRQRIAIARAVIRNPKILILDEPMRGLDVESEARVQEALDRLMENRTTIIITHDLASVSEADQVLVLDDGVIVGRGTYDELLRQKGRYRELLDLAPATAAAQAVSP